MIITENVDETDAIEEGKFDMMHCDNLSSCRVNTYECGNGSDTVRGEPGLCPGCGEVGTRL